MDDPADLAIDLCPRCMKPLEAVEVRSAIWQGEKLAVVMDIPAFVCPVCGEQYYDDDVSEALRRLNEDGFPEEEARGKVEVPVFSLASRIRKRVPLPEDTHVD